MIWSKHKLWCQFVDCRICWKWEQVCYTKRTRCITVIGLTLFRYKCLY